MDKLNIFNDTEAMCDEFVVKDYMKNRRVYDGNSEKFGITVNNKFYIVKLSKKGDLDIYTEYVASNFICKLGIECQKVYLGYYQGKVVNIIEDFTGRNRILHAFKDTKQSSEDTDVNTKNYTYADVIHLIEKNTKIYDLDKEEVIIRFWQMFICDAILANRDRHWGNWGYLKIDDSYRAAPLYDNGACLFPGVYNKWDDYIYDEEEFLKFRVFRIPASLFKMEKLDNSIKRTNYYEMFEDTSWDTIFTKVYLDIKNKYTCEDIFSVISKIVSSPIIDKELSIFMIKIIYLRYACIIQRIDFRTAYKNLKEELVWLE